MEYAEEDGGVPLFRYCAAIVFFERRFSAHLVSFFLSPADKSSAGFQLCAEKRYDMVNLEY